MYLKKVNIFHFTCPFQHINREKVRKKKKNYDFSMLENDFYYVNFDQFH